jgi:ubiquinone/menaquinone biosynthesis C-methylase UbiE
MTKEIKKALITSDGDYIYPVIKEIILLLKDLAVVDNKSKTIEDTISPDKQLVKNFYDQKGWFANEAGDYEDAVIYEDLRDVSRDYIKRCHDRVSRYLNPSGTYMLDAASGALQFSDYLQYSANYKYRVCVDFSFQALMEAKRKIGDKGLCILCDITNLPFKDNVMDGFVSLNTIYHIPKDEQVTAIRELYRTLAPHGKGVVVYDWYKHSLWMNISLLPFRGFVWTKNKVLDVFGKLFKTKGAERRLYFYAHTPQYFKENLPPFKLRVWRTVSVPFQRYYIHSWLFGKKILDWIYNKEEKNPEKFGLRGEYPLLVFEKERQGSGVKS